jgi:hypothetical protein
MAPFIELAHAVRETHTIGLQVLARLTGIAGEAETRGVARPQGAPARGGRNLLVELAPHEPLIRAIVRTGGLAELPEYSADVAQVRVGARALARRGARPHARRMHQVAFEALRPAPASG